MSVTYQIAKEEWRHWRRSRLVLIATLIFTLLIISTAFLTASNISDMRHEREHHQIQAEETFKSQPDRHPHRMVHYGHYVFRTPSPLAVFDPGIDAVTGQSIFLEGHHQNTAMFADNRSKARAGGFGTLSAAKVYQLFLPLLLIAIGHAVLIRERENRTLGSLLAQGVTGTQILGGKALALFGFSLFLTLPALGLTILAIAMGESLAVGVSIYLGYVLFLSVWLGLILCVSVYIKTRGLALGCLLIVWCAASLIVPRLGVATTSALLPMDGKFQTDMKMARDIRALGDGHNTSDPAFARLKANILEQYDVETIEELPLNYRGLVAEVNEVELTNLMNQYAERRMGNEMDQSQVLRQLSFISPFIAIDYSSRHLAGTDLSTHHRFLREAEAVRFDFVSGLNAAHKNQLSYEKDIDRNKNEDAFWDARISSDNWRVLDDFRFEPDPAKIRLSRAGLPLGALVIWLVLLLSIVFSRARKLAP